MDIYSGVLSGDKKSISRLITLVENNDEDGIKIYEKLYCKTGRAKKIGITGPPGAGKSTLVDLIAKQYIENNYKTAIVAVDPSSPFTGGAILGDRIRMKDISLKKNCFIRSMASRGQLGGVSRGTSYAANILDAAGYEYIFIETVGIGQSEIEIIKLTDMVILVTVPDLGDDIQAIKSGIMEIGDIIVVNKSDREGAERTCATINSILALKNGERPDVILTSCINKSGLNDLKNKIDEILNYKGKNGEISKRRKRNDYEELRRSLTEVFIDKIKDSEKLEGVLTLIHERKITPLSGAQLLIKNLCSQEGDYDL
ncbi:GTPase [Fervidicella metallireducens AeB]|uniref:GTPase n=1 Tax=Fervidicella metallireducens AeB TaxID=1403537 RepID=A0A017RU21_9CLOT|nr:methylmalonyl Co-A mutase-associated GTPase MeaB [Fervidicella metallireducens]EYE87934.1 GTPase [Fervidicella metallireducens AeB]